MPLSALFLKKSLFQGPYLLHHFLLPILTSYLFQLVFGNGLNHIFAVPNPISFEINIFKPNQLLVNCDGSVISIFDFMF